MRSFKLGSLATAAVILITLGVVDFGNKAVALDGPLQKAADAETVRYRVHTVSTGDDIETNYKETVIVHGKKIRIDPAEEGFGLTYIVDFEQQGMLFLSHHDKTYQTLDLTAKAGIMPFDAMSRNLRVQIQQLRKQNATLAGKDAIDGVTVDKMTVENGQAAGITGDWTVWFNSKTKLPVKFESVIVSPIWKSPTEKSGLFLTTTRTYDKLEWNAKLNGESFSLDPPDGYTEREIIRTIPPLVPYKKK